MLATKRETSNDRGALTSRAIARASRRAVNPGAPSPITLYPNIQSTKSAHALRRRITQERGGTHAERQVEHELVRVKVRIVPAVVRLEWEFRLGRAPRVRRPRERRAVPGREAHLEGHARAVSRPEPHADARGRGEGPRG